MTLIYIYIYAWIAIGEAFRIGSARSPEEKVFPLAHGCPDRNGFRLELQIVKMPGLSREAITTKNHQLSNIVETNLTSSRPEVVGGYICIHKYFEHC